MEWEAGIAVRNGILSLKRRHYVPKGDISEYWRTLIFLVYYTIIPYKRKEVYRAEKIDMGIARWKNGVSGKWNPINYYGTYCMGKDVLVGVIRC